MASPETYNISTEARRIVDRLGLMTRESSVALIKHYMPRMKKADLARAKQTIKALGYDRNKHDE